MGATRFLRWLPDPHGRAFLSLSMGFTGLPRALAGWIGEQNLSPLVLIAALTVFYVILGMFLDGISSVVLTMAIVEPMIRQAGIDVIWFGIFIVVVVEMAQVTPPIGFNLFVLQGMTKHEIGYIAKTALPMVGLMLVMVGILVVWPELATWLPEHEMIDDGLPIIDLSDASSPTARQTVGKQLVRSIEQMDFLRCRARH